MTDDMNKEPLPEFESEDELRDWFDTADLSAYQLDDALELAVATRVHLVVGDEDVLQGTSGTTGSLARPVHLVS